jgi:hypothetical protein
MEAVAQIVDNAKEYVKKFIPYKEHNEEVKKNSTSTRFPVFKRSSIPARSPIPTVNIMPTISEMPGKYFKVVKISDEDAMGFEEVKHPAKDLKAGEPPPTPPGARKSNV